MGLREDTLSTIKPPKFLIISMAALLLSSALPTFFVFISDISMNNNIQLIRSTEVSSPSSKRPNIILIGSDGLSATNLSLYGYERDTTPELRGLAKTSLVAENAFANSSNSEGSIVSILTGKPPAETRVLYPPNILQGVNAYQYLPGFLRNEGYRTNEITVPHYVDAFKTNLLDELILLTSARSGLIG